MTFKPGDKVQYRDPDKVMDLSEDELSDLRSFSKNGRGPFTVKMVRISHGKPHVVFEENHYYNPYPSKLELVPMVDFNKRITTREGLPVTILTRQRSHKGGANVVALVKELNGDDRVNIYYGDGRYNQYETSPWDLVNAPEIYERWVMYDTCCEDSQVYESYDEALRAYHADTDLTPPVKVTFNARS